MPAQPTPEQDGLQGIASLTLRAAAASVVTGIVRDTGGRPEEVTKEVVDLAGLVENGTGCPDGHAASPARVALRRRLLDRLFAEVLEEWARLRVPPAGRGAGGDGAIDGIERREPFSHSILRKWGTND